MDIQFLGTGAGQPSKPAMFSLALKLLDEINEFGSLTVEKERKIAF